MSEFGFSYQKVQSGYQAPKGGYLEVVVTPVSLASQNIQAQSVEWREGCMFITVDEHEVIIRPNSSYNRVSVKAFTKKRSTNDQQDVPVGDQR
jgi:hypothetical protein